MNGSQERPEGAEALVTVSDPLLSVVTPLVLTLFPGVSLVEERAGGRVTLLTAPPVGKQGRRKLLGYLSQLAAREEWATRYAFAREVTDAAGARMELLLPVEPAAYRGGEAVVGPFDSEEDAAGWAGALADRSLASDVTRVQGKVLVDLFELGPLLAD